MRRWNVVLLFCGLAPGLFVAAASCGDDPLAEASDAGSDPEPVDDPGPSGRDGAASPEGAAPRPPPPVLPECVGESRPLVTSGERAYVAVNVGTDGGTARGDFLVDFGANTSTIDLRGFGDAGAPIPKSCLGDAGGPGALCTFDGFDFFGPWGTVTLATGDYGFLINSVRQAGILGTDFLSVFPFSLEYTNRAIRKSSTAGFCTDAQLLAAGLQPMSTAGFYTNQSGKLRPLSDVITNPDAGVGAFVVPNVPTVPITIAGVPALAQIDSGYDDRLIRHSINVNEAFLKELTTRAPGAITRDEGQDLFLTTCVAGLSQLARAYVLKLGTLVEFTGLQGAPVRREGGTYVFVKDATDESFRCGGIDTWTVPAAQLGASFLTDAQAVVFDPVASRVWLPGN